MPANPRCWVRCLACGHREMIRRSWLDRASRPRCSRCGGPIEPSPDARAALARGMDRARAQKERCA